MATQYPVTKYNVIITKVMHTAAGTPVRQFDRLIYFSPVDGCTKSLPFRTNALIDFGKESFDKAVELLSRYLKEHFFVGEEGVISIVRTDQQSKYCLSTQIVETSKYRLTIEEAESGYEFKVIQYVD